MEIRLDERAAGWQEKARRFATEELIPCELEAEMDSGRLRPETSARHRDMAIELGFSAMDVPLDRGGLGARILDQVVVWEQLGRVTNALCWCFSEPQSWMFEACSEDHIGSYILPLIDGSRKECFAIRESGSGSDVAIETTARPVAGGYRISGEKWYVTSANHADFFFLQASLAAGPHAGAHSLFLVDKGSPGIELVRTPQFSHTFDHHYPIYRFNDVAVPEANGSGRRAPGWASPTAGSAASA